MSIEGLVRVQVERAERIDIDGLGTVRMPARLPAMVQIVNLSRSGCLFHAAEKPAIGTRLSIGIPGIGSRRAVVMRSGADGVGCAFDMLLRPSDVDKARAARAIDENAASTTVRRLRRAISARGEEAPASSWLSRLTAR